MKSIIEDIKNLEFKTVYLLYGDETYLKTQYRNKLKNAILPEGDTMNLSIYEGKGISVREVIDQAETMPFFADHRLILIENSGFFKNASPEMADYIAEIPAETCIVFVEEEVDKRGKLYKAVKSKGRVTEFGRQDERTLKRWVLGLLGKENKKVTENTLNHLLNTTGTDMEYIAREVEKLLCYTLDREVIEESDIDEICVARTENKIFEMINAIAEKKQKRALELYYDLLALKEPPMRILYLITRQFNMLMQAKELKTQGFDSGSIASKMKLQPFILKNYLRQMEHFSLDVLKQAVQDCVEAEESVKTGRMNDVMSVELLIVNYSA